VDETREYGTWADWLGVPRHTFHAMFGAVIAQGPDYRETFEEFRPGFDLYEEREKRAAAGQPGSLGRGSVRGRPDGPAAAPGRRAVARDRRQPGPRALQTGCRGCALRGSETLYVGDR
jgi:hypothetical protein